MLSWLFGRSLEDALLKTYKVKVHGVIFRVRKINPLDHLTGAQVIQKHFDTYKTKAEKENPITPGYVAKLKEHYKDVFLAAVVEPKLKRKEEGEGILVDNLFTDWDLAQELYLQIMQVTHGKKKLRSLIARETASLNATS